MTLRNFRSAIEARWNRGPFLDFCVVRRPTLSAKTPAQYGFELAQANDHPCLRLIGALTRSKHESHFFTSADDNKSAQKG